MSIIQGGWFSYVKKGGEGSTRWWLGYSRRWDNLKEGLEERRGFLLLSRSGDKSKSGLSWNFSAKPKFIPIIGIRETFFPFTFLYLSWAFYFPSNFLFEHFQAFGKVMIEQWTLVHTYTLHLDWPILIFLHQFFHCLFWWTIGEWVAEILTLHSA